jgi:hypothetical protein
MIPLSSPSRGFPGRSRHPVRMPAPREFKTAEGIGVGSSTEEVRRAFGAPSSMNQRILDPLDAIRWWYDRTGIFFDFVDARVFSLGVYVPRLCGLGHE